MRRTSRRCPLLGSAAVLTAAGMLITACGDGESGEGESGGTLTFAVETDPTCIDPQQPTVTQALYVGRQVVDSLVDQDPETGEFVPWLAEEFEPNEDMTAFEFILREDVTFSDGSELTPEVVEANFETVVEMAADGSTASLAGEYLAGYEGIEIADDRTFTVMFSSPNAAFLQGASTMSLGIVSEESTQLSPEERCNEGIVGTGPFVYDAYTPNSEVTMDKREDYDWASELRDHQGEAYLDRIEFLVIDETSVRVGGLESGEFDMIGEVPYTEASRIAEEFTLYEWPNPGVPLSIIPNLEGSEVLADDAVREALQLGVNREEIRDALGYENGETPTSVLTSGTAGHTDQEELIRYAPDEAEQILEDAGWTEGTDGIREHEGEPLSFTITAFYEQEMLELMQIQLGEIGVEMLIDYTDAGGFFGAIAERSYDALYAGLTRTDPDVLRIIASQDSASHWMVAEDEEMEQLLAEQAAAADPDERQAILDEAQNLLVERGYLIPVLEGYQLHASQPETSGLAFDSASRFHLYDVTLD